MPAVRIDDPPAMNVLGLFLASALRRNLVARARPCRLRGCLAIDAEGMRASVRFEEDEVTVTRQETPGATTVSGTLPELVAAIVKPRPWTLLRLRLRGNPLFALRAMRYLKP